MCCAESVAAATRHATSTLQPRRLDNRSLRHHVTRIHRRRGLEEEHVDFVLGDRAMLDASGNDQELAFLEGDVTIAELHREATLHNEEQLVLALMLMPDELALKLHELDVLPVQLPDDLRIPVRIKERELLAEVDAFDHWPTLARIDGRPTLACVRCRDISMPSMSGDD